MITDFDKLVLNEDEQKILSKADDAWIPYSPSLKHLQSEELLHYNITGYSGEPGYTLTDHGRSYLRYIERENKRNTVTRNEFKVTTGIALIALVLSVISIIVELLK